MSWTNIKYAFNGRYQQEFYGEMERNVASNYAINNNYPKYDGPLIIDSIQLLDYFGKHCIINTETATFTEALQ